MSILTIELPEETMTVLQRVAQERGETVESIAREWVQIRIENERVAGEWMKLAGIFSSGTSEEGDWQNDPFWQARGSVEGETPSDLARNHDFYLAQEAVDRHEAV